MLNSINFSRLLEIHRGSIMTDVEYLLLHHKNVVYAIYNDNINKMYIGETDDLYNRLFTFWKEDKRHVNGENSPIIKIFQGDYENTKLLILEYDCNNIIREYYWHEYYRTLKKYVIVSHPGRHGCTNPGNKGLIAIHKDNFQMYINKQDLEIFIKDGWEKGGKKNKPRTKEQKDNISKGHLNKIPWNKGLKISEEQKSTWKSYPSNRKSHKVTDDTKQLLSKKNIGKIKIHKDLIEKQINPSEFANYEKLGWKKGVLKKLALFEKPDGSFVEYDKCSAKRNYKDWKFIKDL